MGVIRRLSDKYSGVALVNSDNEKNNKESAFCQQCLEFANIRVRLEKRLYLPDESGQTVIPPDADKWRQCHNCGTVYPKYQVKQEADIVTLTEPRDSPQFSSGDVHSGESRKFDRTCRTQYKKQFKQDLSQYKEVEIINALKRGAKLISYVET